MMRVVFLLFAEERRLLPSDDDTYVESYSVGRLVEQLESTGHAGRRGGPRAPQRRLAPAPGRGPGLARRRRPRGPAPARLRRRACSTPTATHGWKAEGPGEPSRVAPPSDR